MVVYERPKVAAGHNNAAGLANFASPPSGVDPSTKVVLDGIIHISVSGKVNEDGDRSAVWVWDGKIPSAVKLDALTKCGLSNTTKSANVTARLPSNADRTVWANYNAVAFYPAEDEFHMGGWTGFEIRLLFLDAI